MVIQIHPDQILDNIEIRSFLTQRGLSAVMEEDMDFASLRTVDQRIQFLLNSKTAKHFFPLVLIEIVDCETDPFPEESEIQPEEDLAVEEDYEVKSLAIMVFEASEGKKPDPLFINYGGEIYLDLEKQFLAYFDPSQITRNWMIYNAK